MRNGLWSFQAMFSGLQLVMWSRDFRSGPPAHMPRPELRILHSPTARPWPRKFLDFSASCLLIDPHYQRNAFTKYFQRSNL